jgi:hypothetical protein
MLQVGERAGQFRFLIIDRAGRTSGAVQPIYAFACRDRRVKQEPPGIGAGRPIVQRSDQRRLMLKMGSAASSRNVVSNCGVLATLMLRSDITLANNILIGRRAARVERGNRLTWTGNLGSGSTLGVPSGGFRQADTKLVKDAFSVYRPAPGSAAIGAALGSFASVTADVDGQRRPTYKRTVGADEPNTTASGASL